MGAGRGECTGTIDGEQGGEEAATKSRREEAVANDAPEAEASTVLGARAVREAMERVREVGAAEARERERKPKLT